jgi:flagellar protein FlbD
MKSVRALIIDDSSDLIKFVEQIPDTVITLLNGEKILVRESAEEILDRIIQFRRRLLSGMSIGSQAPITMLPAAPESPTEESEG